MELSGYLIKEEVYEGELFFIFRALRKNDNKLVILKVLKNDHPTSEQLNRLKTEYEIGKKIQSEGVLTVYALEQSENSIFLAFEDFEGQSLKAYLATNNLDPINFLRLAIAITEVLGEIHEHFIIHKDINPSNILINPKTKKIKIIDFGVATLLPRERLEARNPKVLEGTLVYMSPEQTGRMNRGIDYRTDYYSLGISFYEMLTKQLPFESQDAIEIIHAHLAKTPAAPYEVNPNIPKEISDIVMKCLEKTPEKRYQSAFGLKYDLQQCLDQLQQLGTIGTFEIGAKDISSRFQISEKIYGRDEEINLLLDTFERASIWQSELILITGDAGSGKSTLAQEIQKAIMQKKGYFIQGKFSETSHNVPYFGLIQAIQGLTRKILSETQEGINIWKERLLAALGTNGKLITDIFPELIAIIGPQPEIAEITPTESQNRFLIVFQSFISSLATQKNPLVIFLDDVQSADPASLKLLELLISQTESRYILTILGYKEQEIDSSHPFRRILEGIQKKGTSINFIQLGHLKFADVEQLLADTLHCTAKASSALAKLCYDKTQGNPFFLHQFLNNLYQESLITFSSKTGGWWWDIEEIKKQAITDNVVELMAQKLHKLPKETQAVIELASCIGNQFDLQILSFLSEKSLKQTSQELWKSLEEGLILPLDNHYQSVENVPNFNVNYRFQHTRVQQAAYSLVSTTNKQHYHLKIGRWLLQNAPQEKQAAIIFDIVSHLNLAIDLITTPEEMISIAELNLIAAKKARTSAAYDTTIAYTSIAIKLLGETAWNKHYPLMLELQNISAESAYLVGDFSRMNNSIEAVLKNAKDILDEVKVYIVKIAYYVSDQRPEQAAELAFPILSRLHINFPRHPNLFHVALVFLHSQLLLLTKSIEDLKNLPPMTNPHAIAAMQIMIVFMPAIYVYVPKLVPIMMLKILIISLQYGNSPLSGSSYGGQGIFLAGFLNRIEKGYEYAKLAFYIVDRSPQKVVLPLVWLGGYFCVAHWKISLREVAQHLLEAHQVALANGDLLHVGSSSNIYCVSLFLAGEELTLVFSEMQKYANLNLKINQKLHYTALSVHSQAINNLLEPSTDPTSLVGRYFNEETANINDDIHLLSIVCFQKMILNYLFGDYEQAIKNATIAKKWAIQATPFVPYINFYESLSYLAHFRYSKGLKRKWLLRRIEKNQKKLRLWGKHGPINYSHKYHLVEAEKYRALNLYHLAEINYEKAIKLAGENKYIHEEALANELGSIFHFECGNEKIAKLYLTDAHYSYKKWGAQAKVKALEERYPWLKTSSRNRQKATLTLPAQVSVMSSVTPYATTTDTLDLGTVLKASQAISTELELPKLITKMLRILVENLGAERGVLVLEENHQLGIAGEYLISAQENSGSELKLLTEDNLPISIIQYVYRSKDVVLLESSDNQFNLDNYITTRKPKSILCAPVLRHSHLIGILYFENNLVTNAFALDHLEILSMLSGQIAVSIENAKFYQSSQRFVPKQFLELLGKESLIDVKLGDYTQKILTAMFIDIREFTKISENNDPKLIFSIINQYLGGIEPIITKHGGLIDKYIGDTIVILFVKSSDDAINAGIEIQEWLYQFNTSLNTQKNLAIKVGIGINTGLAMIGTIGSERRMDGTVLSDAINTASRIEGLNKTYGTRMLMTENTADSLKNYHRYSIRQIDKVRVKGKTQALRIFEVLDGLPKAQRKARLSTLQAFNKARELYLDRQFKAAKTLLLSCLEKDPNDKVCRIYVRRCENFLNHPCPPEWDGTTDFTTK